MGRSKSWADVCQQEKIDMARREQSVPETIRTEEKGLSGAKLYGQHV